jgi:hypothetical protein
VNAIETAAQSFFFLVKIARLLDEGHKNGCDLKYEIDWDSPPNGYTIRIKIDPPLKADHSTPQIIEHRETG